MKLFLKITKISLVLLFIFIFSLSTTYAAPAIPDRELCEKDPTLTNCECILEFKNCEELCSDLKNYPRVSFQSSAQCVAVDLGIPSVEIKDLGIKRNSNNTIRILLQVGFGLLVAVAVFLIVLAGLSVANAKEDVDKRKEGVKKMVNVLIGLVVIFSSYGLALFVFNIFGGEGTDNLIVDCQKLKDKGYDEGVIQRCLDQQKGDVTPTP